MLPTIPFDRIANRQTKRPDGVTHLSEKHLIGWKKGNPAVRQLYKSVKTLFKPCDASWVQGYKLMRSTEKREKVDRPKCHYDILTGHLCYP